MGLIEIDTSNEDLFKAFEFKVLSKGKHLLEIAKDLKVEACAPPSENNIIKVELRCQDEDDNKGAVIYDNIVLMTNPQTEGQRKAKKINQGRLCQMAVACGVATQEEIEQGAGIPLESFKGTRCEAITRVTPIKDPNTGEVRQRAEIVRYLFEPEKGA